MTTKTPPPEAPKEPATRTWVVTPIYISDEESVERAAKLAREYGEYLAAKKTNPS